MTIQVDTLVLGGGAMGSAAAWQLARRGREVTLLERFGPGHKNGASHGASRNFNIAYPDPVHLGLVREALGHWRDLEAETSTEILDQVGLTYHGSQLDYDDLAARLVAHGFAPELLTPDAATERWPGIRFDRRVLFAPEAGRLHADRAVAALQQAATQHGATVHHHARVTDIQVKGDDRVLVTVVDGSGARDDHRADAREDSSGQSGVGDDAASPGPDGETQIYEARRVVVTLGAWTEKLVGHAIALPELVVTQEQPAHFAVRDPSVAWPGFSHSPDFSDPAYGYWYSGVYGMFTPGEGVKAGWHGTGPRVDPDARTFQPEPRQLAALQRYASDWLPGVDPGVFTDISCTYTTTPDSMFVVDAAGPLVVGAGFSGHGFKFTPSIGRVIADLVDGTGAAPDLFSLRRVRQAVEHPAAPRASPRAID